MNLRRVLSKSTSRIAMLLLVPCLVLAVFTYANIKTLPVELTVYISNKRTIYYDRNGQRLNRSYLNRWNQDDIVQLNDVPELLIQAFVLAEDKRFYAHSGVDWLARFHALGQNVLALERVRGASTISEQIVKMIHPRPRTIWSRWLEGFEATILERRFSKDELLSFYINQLPYGARQRGVKQAAAYYFDRDVNTLNALEQLALVVMVRSPKWYDPVHRRDALREAVQRLLILVREVKPALLPPEVILSQLEVIPQVAAQRGGEKWQDYSHVIAHLQQRYPQLDRFDTTLDSAVQRQGQVILDQHLNRLRQRKVNNGALLVADHQGEILAWVVAGAGKANHVGNKFNSVVSKRQPGSTLKPLLYAAAMEKGWTAATQLDDSPLSEGVGAGLHTYHNYSGRYYGEVSLRHALGNSLNIPAVKALQFVGTDQFIEYLKGLGIQNLALHPNVYGDGLALGNGEISLLELVQAYTTLARLGDFKSLSLNQNQHFELSLGQKAGSKMNSDVASIIGDILSDANARQLEFGAESVLNLPHQTAVKTGTSSDYRDAWAIGFNDRFTVGVWMGNLDYQPMQKITGASGPALVMRSMFDRLNRHRRVARLPLSPGVVKKTICRPNQNDSCDHVEELFVAEQQITETDLSLSSAAKLDTGVRIRQPSRGLMMAMDPRIPDQHEQFEFRLNEQKLPFVANWYLDDVLLATTTQVSLMWSLQSGPHRLKVVLYSTLSDETYVDTVNFIVK